jgi:CRP/FNR family transcriptional regulator, anaerobic regulatory protein
LIDSALKKQWLSLFPPLSSVQSPHYEQLVDEINFKVLKKGQIAYQPGWECEAFLMCLTGRTRVFKSSESGREILLYRVEAGQTCVLTTSCILSDTPFPAESIAELDTTLAAIKLPAFKKLMEESLAFRHFVFDNYGELLSSLIVLVDEVAFSSIDIRLAKYLTKEVDDQDILHKTHQQLAMDLGSVREVISRHLNEWERQDLLEISRGKIQIKNKKFFENYA